MDGPAAASGARRRRFPDDGGVHGPRLSRRQLLAAGAAAGVALRLPAAAAAARRQAGAAARLDFAAVGGGGGWPGWTCPGVANLRREGGRGVLEAGSDVFPCDPRPVAFAVDHRFRDGAIEASVAAAGAGTGVVLRRTGPRAYYAAIHDGETGALVLVRRLGTQLDELARVPVAAAAPFRLTLEAAGADPTLLTATLSIAGQVPVAVTARDAAPELQRDGDPGVLATARTLFPSEGPPVLPALGNLHLLPYGVQEGQAFIESPAGQSVVGAIRQRSTAEFSEIALRTSERPRATAPSVVAATAGTPMRSGATVRVATDVAARVQVELSSDPGFRRARRLRPRRTNAFDAVLPTASGLDPGERVYWRARAERGGRTRVGPVRSFRTLPAAGDTAPVRFAIGSCAAQFGPLFDLVAQRRPDAFVWQGDLNYPDTMGPLAQTVPGYAGIWRDFLANPRMEGIFAHSLFAAQRDDHDYGLQDANSLNLPPWGLRPWEGLIERRPWYRFTAGVAEVWVLDQRQFKSDPAAPDDPAKTLLGARQRAWLLDTLAASRAPFKVVCSPCTLAPLDANARDGSWAAGFTAERDLLLAHVREHVGGQTIFVTGDTHWTLVYDRDGLFEARPCPLGIPTPNDITLTQPNVGEEARTVPGVAYADDERGHVAVLELGGGGAGRARLDLTMLREDGTEPYRRSFEQPL